MSHQIHGRHIIGGIALAALFSLPFDAMIVNATITDIRMEQAFRAAAKRAADRAIADTVSDAPQPDQSATTSTFGSRSEDGPEESPLAAGGAAVSREDGSSKAGETATSGLGTASRNDHLHSVSVHAGPERRGNQGVTAGETALRTLANEIADERRIPRSLLASLVTDESTWRSKVRGKHGEVGLLQLKKETARWCGGTVDREDPEQNLQCGARYLRAQFEAFGSWELAVVAFKAGPKSIPDNIPEASWAYAQRTMRRAGDLR